MSIKTYIPFAFRVLRWLAKSLISLSGDEAEIELFNGVAYTIKLVKVPIGVEDE